MKYAYILSGSIAGVIYGLFSGVPQVVYALLGLMALDIISGWIANIGSLSSEKSYVGTLKKSVILIVVAATYILGKVTPFGVVLGHAVAGAFCATEFLSIVENASKCGIQIPRPLADAVSKLRGDKDASDRRD